MTFGAAVAERTLARIDHTIEQHLARYPKKSFDDRLGVYVYAVLHTPFVLIYDFDDEEIRVHLILLCPRAPIARASILRLLNGSSAAQLFLTRALSCAGLDEAGDRDDHS
jgi:hypothetical protein